MSPTIWYGIFCGLSRAWYICDKIKSASIDMKILRRLLRATALIGLGIVGTVQASAQEFATTPDFLTNILLNDSLGGGLCSEAKMIIGRPFSPEKHTTSREQKRLMAFLNAPRVLDARSFTTLSIKQLEPLKPVFGKESIWSAFLKENLNKQLGESQFHKMAQSWYNAQVVKEQAMLATPQLIQLSINDLPEAIKAKEIQAEGYHGQLAYNEAPQINVENNNIITEKVERKYWWHNFEGSTQFAQNQVSKNWHKGGHNSLNVNARLYYKATYDKNIVKWVNELEYRIGLFTNDIGTDEKLQLKIGEDIFRAYSNLGVKAFDHWYYTLSAQLRSQAFTNTNADGLVITRPFAPFSVDGGLGMKYELDLKKFRDNPFARFRFSANIAPVGMDFVYSYSNDIDKGRIGLKPDQKYRFRYGSSVRLDLNWDFSSSLNWTSRLFYNTSYKHIEVEFDNILSYSFNQFFSLRMTLNTRYDDSVILPAGEAKTFKNLLQYNELLSIGFAYKL